MLFLQKGIFVPAEVVDGNVLASWNGEVSDVTSQLDGETLTYIRHIGRCLITAGEQENMLTGIYYASTHTHSMYSLLDGMSKIKDLVQKTEGVMALTDHGNMFGFLKFFTAMKEAGKKPIIGSELYVETIAGEKCGCHLIALAKNEVGKSNLFTLSSIAYQNYHKKPHVPYEALKRYHEGLIITSACIGGEVARLLVKDDYTGAKKVAETYQGIFGEDYYLEIQRHNLEAEQKVNPYLIQLSKELGIKLVAANDSHYIKPEHDRTHEYLICINDKKKITEPHRIFDGSGYYFFSQKEMADLFWDLPEAISSTIEIAEKCQLEIETGKYHLPVFDIPNDYEDEIQYLDHLIDQGFQSRYGGTPLEHDPVRIERLAYEKNVIFSMGYAAYFLIVWDYVTWAKDHGILVGPGRGSAAGSLASYCLGITDLDPIPYNLLFERFLNPDRISMPDIDMDFEYTRREEVIEYLKQKYGENRVCNIVTFGTMAAKSVIKDIARVDGEYMLGEILAKKIPEEPGITIQKALENPELKEMYDNDAISRSIINRAMILEGNARQTSCHACGIVVAPDSVYKFLPTAMIQKTDTQEKYLTSQVTMTEVEELGLLKMDFLGLRTMTVIGDALNSLNRKRKMAGEPIIKHYRDIPLNDPYVYADIAKGKSYAVFQIESVGMREFMTKMFADVDKRIHEMELRYSETGFTIGGNSEFQKELENFGDELFERMIAAVSLYRPGPMDYIPDFIRGIQNPSAIVYDVPALEPILKPTYGVIVYQEQVMQIVRELAGFTNGQSDTIRKAMGKKKEEILNEYCPYFISGSGDKIDAHTGEPLGIRGCEANGISKDKAKLIWEKMKDFAKYAFNKSHAAVYAVITIVCAWLKYYYPVEFMSATLNSVVDKSDKMRGYISIIKRMGIQILPPNINKSEATFSIEGDAIRFGLSGIKGWNKLVDDLVEERQSGGDYTGVQNFTERMMRRSSVSTKTLESLIYSGSMDIFPGSRAAKLSVVKKVLNASVAINKDKEAGQFSLFDICEDMYGMNEVPTPNIPELPKNEMLEREKEYVGFYITEHPIDQYSKLLHENDVDSISNIITDPDNGVSVRTAGIVRECKTVVTKKDGLPMGIFTLEDDAEEVSCVCFPKNYMRLRQILTEGAVVLVQGMVGVDDNYGTQIIVQTVTELSVLSEVYNKTVTKVCIRLQTSSEMNELLNIVRSYSGGIPVIAQIEHKLYRLNDTVDASSGLFMMLSSRFGHENVIYK